MQRGGGVVGEVRDGIDVRWLEVRMDGGAVMGARAGRRRRWLMIHHADERQRSAAMTGKCRSFGAFWRIRRRTRAATAVMSWRRGAERNGGRCRSDCLRRPRRDARVQIVRRERARATMAKGTCAPRGDACFGDKFARVATHALSALPGALRAPNACAHAHTRRNVRPISDSAHF